MRLGGEDYHYLLQKTLHLLIQISLITSFTDTNQIITIYYKRTFILDKYLFRITKNYNNNFF